MDLASIAKVQRLIVNGFLSLAAWHEEAGDIRQALDHHKRARALQEELQRAEVHATGTAHQIWIRFQQLRREVKSYQEHAELLVRDNGELATRVDRLVRVAHEDALTGLSNRRYLDMRLAESRRGGEQEQPQDVRRHRRHRPLQGDQRRVFPCARGIRCCAWWRT